MTAADYDDPRNLKLFIRFFTFLIALIKRV